MVLTRIGKDPFGKLYAVLRGAPYEPLPKQEQEQLLINALLSSAAPDHSAEASASGLLVCLDQFEELFVTVRDEIRRGFIRTLKVAMGQSTLRLVIAMRSDFRDLFDRLCREDDPELEYLTIGNYYTLRAFRKKQSEEILVELLQPVAAGDPLLKQQMENFATELTRELLRPPRDQRLSRDDEMTVLPVELQTVGLMVESFGVESFSAAQFRRLGGKVALIRAYIDDATTYVLRKTGTPRGESLLILRQLISPAHTKWACSTAFVAQAVRLTPHQVDRVLRAFQERFLVKEVPPEESATLGADNDDLQYYELIHEGLIQLLREAPQRALQEARDAEERLNFWVKRSASLSAAEGEKTSWKKVRGMFSAPIPFSEAFNLRKYATTLAAQALVRKSLIGFAFRISTIIISAVGILATMAVLMLQQSELHRRQAAMMERNTAEQLRRAQATLDSLATQALAIEDDRQRVRQVLDSLTLIARQKR